MDVEKGVAWHVWLPATNVGGEDEVRVGHVADAADNVNGCVSWHI